MHFSQGYAPQDRVSLSTSDVASEADAISQALEKASEVALWEKDHPPKDAASRPTKEYKHDLVILHEAVQTVAQLPAALLPSDLPPAYVMSASMALTEARSSNQISDLEIVIDVLEKAKKMPDLLRDVPNLPPISTELGPPRHFDYGATIKRVRVGVMIELSTIPLYLYAMYSVKPQSEGLRVRALLRVILQQEMLHLALAGNLLSALGGSVALYDPRIVPIFPAPLLCSKIPMHLEALNTGSIGRYMEIEAPVDATHPSSRPDDRNILASQYDSIGQLYEDVVLSVRGLEDKLFTNNMNNQFTGQDFFGGQLFPVVDKSTALKALGTIVEQGEGNLSVENSHYEVFSALYSGPAWEVHAVPTDPKTEDYILNFYVHRLSLSFDAAYCYLLQTIQRIWVTDDASDRRILLRNIHGIMSNVLTPLAELLVQQNFKDGCAAPCFDYYPMRGSVAKDPLVPVELHKSLVMEVQAAAKLAPSDDVVARGAQIAAGRAADEVQAASTNANDAAPESSDAQKAAEIAGKVASAATQLRDYRPSNAAAKIVQLATQIGQDAVQAAIHVQATARIGTKSNIKAARQAADAAIHLKEAGEAAGKAARRSSEKASLQRLKSYIEDNLYPPY